MIDLNTFNSEAPSICPASIISDGIAFIAADKTTAANPVYIQIIIAISRNVLIGKLTNISPNQPVPSSRFPIGNADKSLC